MKEIIQLVIILLTLPLLVLWIALGLLYCVISVGFNFGNGDFRDE